MRDNEETILVGSKVVLVPYRRQHVERYHAWMTDPEIRQQTASEPLTIEEEYDMQESWHKDDDKLTFIVLARGEDGKQRYGSAEEAIAGAQMAGDVNLFLSERHEDDDEDEEGGANAESVQIDDKAKTLVYDAELEVMIAEPSCRRKGLAREALGLLIYYASRAPKAAGVAEPVATTQSAKDTKTLPLPLDAFVAKVGIDNAPSLHMFASMGFHEVKRSTVWREAELRPDPARSDVFSGSIVAPLQILRWQR